MIIELRTGHVFVAESVRAVIPVDAHSYEVVGVGFRVTIDPLSGSATSNLAKIIAAGLLDIDPIELIKLEIEIKAIEKGGYAGEASFPMLTKHRKELSASRPRFLELCRREAIEKLLRSS